MGIDRSGHSGAKSGNVEHSEACAAAVTRSLVTKKGEEGIERRLGMHPKSKRSHSTRQRQLNQPYGHTVLWAGFKNIRIPSKKEK